MIGELGEPENRERRSSSLAIVCSAGGVHHLCARVGANPGYLHDLTRHVPGAPVGTMELINGSAIDRFREEGVPYLHFGFTPFIVSGAEPAGFNRLFSRSVELLGRYGSAVYPAQTQVSYKLKWGPDLIEKRVPGGPPARDSRRARSPPSHTLAVSDLQSAVTRTLGRDSSRDRVRPYHGSTGPL